MADAEQVAAAAKTYVYGYPLVYSIGDRTPGLVVSDDGAVTIRMQADDPGDDRVNWLAAPPGAFRPVLRSYQPTGTTLDGSYQLPTLRRRS